MLFFKCGPSTWQDSSAVAPHDKQRGGGALEEKEVPASKIKVKFGSWQGLQRERHVNLWAGCVID